MKNLCLFLILSVLSTSFAYGQATLISQKLETAKKFLHTDVQLGLTAVSERFKRIQTLEAQVKRGEAEYSKLLNEVVEWRNETQKLEKLRFQLAQDLETIKKEVEGQRKEFKISNEKYQSLSAAHEALSKEKGDLDEKYLQLHEDYEDMAKENTYLKAKIEVLQKELSTSAKLNFKKSGVSVCFFYKDKKLNDPCVNIDGNEISKRYEAIEVKIEFSISKNADILPKDLKNIQGIVKLNFEGNFNLSQKVTLSRKTEDGFWIFSGSYAFPKDEKWKILNLKNTIEIEINELEDFLVNKKIIFER